MCRLRINLREIPVRKQPFRKEFRFRYVVTITTSSGIVRSSRRLCRHGMSGNSIVRGPDRLLMKHPRTQLSTGRAEVKTRKLITSTRNRSTHGWIQLSRWKQTPKSDGSVERSELATLCDR